MGIYSEYLDRQMDMAQLTAERKAQLGRIASIRGRDVLVIAADLQKSNLPIAINYSDLLAINDQLSNLNGKALDLVLETPGGSGETVEDIVKLLRGKYESLAIIVPGTAKSAGTIMAMAADELLMEPASSLGPIDAQIVSQGKVFSAHALLEAMDKIKAEVLSSGSLNRAYVPILQGLSLGELQGAQHAFDFARDLVMEWLTNFKFKNWHTHTSTRQPVTPEDRRNRAKEIADQLRDQSRWKTHGRSIKIEDLRAMKLYVTDYSGQPELCDAIRRYHVLLQMTFSSNLFKIFETPVSQIVRMAPIKGIPLPSGNKSVVEAELNVVCNHCKTNMIVQAALVPGVRLKPGRLPFPANNRLECSGCQTEHDLSDARRQIEAQTKLPVLTPEA